MKKTLLMLLVLPIVAGCGGSSVLPPPTTAASVVTESIETRYAQCESDVRTTLLEIKPILASYDEVAAHPVSMSATAEKLSDQMRTTVSNMQRRCQNFVPECLTVVDPVVDYFDRTASRLAALAVGNDPGAEAVPFTDLITRC